MNTQFSRQLKGVSGWCLTALLLLGAASTIVAQDAPDAITPLDLHPHYDLLAGESSQFGMWEVVPKGKQTFSDVPFDIGGMMRLYGQIPPPHGTIYRSKIPGIEVGRKFDGLYLLHGTGWTTDDGVEIAKIVFNYTDGTDCSLPIKYGEHVRDWWKRENSSADAVADPNSKIAWTGSHSGVGLRFYQTVLANPYADKEVKTIDVVSARSAVTPAIVAMSVGPAPKQGSRLAKVVSRPKAAEVTPFKVKVVDFESGEPLVNAALNATFCDESSCRYLGAFALDETGDKELAFPTKQLRAVGVKIVADGYTTSEYEWEEGDNELPAAVTVQLSKGSGSERAVLKDHPEGAAKVRGAVGTLAPDFELQTLDGKPLKLSDFRGKYLLLDFWAVWCGPCVAEMPHLKEVYAEFGDDKRFAMVGLTFDKKAETTQRFAEEKSVNWTQGFIGDNTAVATRYGVKSIPSLFLIDPDGKIIAKGMRGSAIKSAVAKALGE